MTELYKLVAKISVSAFVVLSLINALPLPLLVFQLVGALVIVSFLVSWNSVKVYYARISGEENRMLSLWENHYSPLTWLMQHTFRFFRFFSPLQHIKRFVRFVRMHYSLGEVQKRPDFHAKDTEVYFLVVMGMFIVAYVCGDNIASWLASYPAINMERWRIIITGLVCLLTFEAFTWISYYLFWRNFAEARYTLYHPAEYFVMFPLVLGVQIMGFSYISGESPWELIQAIFNATKNSNLSEWKVTFLKILSFFYFTVFFANLRSMVPTTKFKSTTTVNIIGAGDVVINRILPALLRERMKGEQDFLSPLTKRHVKVYTITDDIAGAQTIKSGKVLVQNAAKSAIVADTVAEQVPVIIATPSDTHFAYLSALVSSGVKCAIEKPMSTNAAEISLLKQNAETYRASTFALSYYALEKALPITYLLSGNPYYERFLTVGSGKELTHSKLGQLYRSLGRLKSLDIALVEGAVRSPSAGNRAWTEVPNGLAFETLIHPLTIAYKFIAKERLNWNSFTPKVIKGRSAAAVSDNKKVETYIQLRGTIPYEGVNAPGRAPGDGVKINLITAKYANEQTRCGKAMFDNGFITFNFDQMQATIKNTVDGTEETIMVCPEFQHKYYVQTDLVRLFFNAGWTDLRYDDFDDQLSLLEWLSIKDLSGKITFSYGLEKGYAALEEKLCRKDFEV
ncbi:Gfo/Idh/MocA family oxidoreductase [Kordiimonas pumila]|uniref:Gfo/Idh/MocA family oxidoreductase n=1 Tax=Kordiimonas pumila TaxID=2161677 RepID=A0ABV7D3D6_9PROT|nr:Gfo/Idh/MocA family oxidoreductase [Kordiimonas pumila]